MKIIRFLRRKSPYNTGETAGFPDTRADELVLEGVAEFYVPPVNKVEPPDEAKVEPDADTPTEAPPPETKVEPPPPVTKVEPQVKRRTVASAGKPD